MAAELGYAGGKTIFDDYVREVRPRFLVRRTFQRTVYRPGELVQCDLWEPREQIPVGHGQTRRGYVVTAELCWSRVIAGALIFSKEAPDILWGLGRCLSRIGALPEKLVWDREGAIAPAAAARPTRSPRFCGQLGVGWVILDAGDAQAKGAAGALASLHAHELRAGPAVREPARLPAASSTAGASRSTSACIAPSAPSPPSGSPRSARGCGRCPQRLPDSDRRFGGARAAAALSARRSQRLLDRSRVRRPPRRAARLPARGDRGRRWTPASSPAATGAAFAGGLTFTDPAHQAELERQRARRRRGHDVEVEIRPLARYDQLIPA